MELHRRKNVAAGFDAVLVSTVSRPFYKSGATLAAGDIKVIKDGGSPVNITALPVEIDSTGVYRFSLTAAEMNAVTITVVCRDAAGGEWDPLAVNIL